MGSGIILGKRIRKFFKLWNIWMIFYGSCNRETFFFKSISHPLYLWIDVLSSNKKDVILQFLRSRNFWTIVFPNIEEMIFWNSCKLFFLETHSIIIVSLWIYYLRYYLWVKKSNCTIFKYKIWEKYSLPLLGDRVILTS